jgi:drug/metabolite transporter (DMT)-like permease
MPAPSALPPALPPLVLTLVGACIISFSAVWVELAAVAPTVSAFYRVFFGFLCLLTACLVRGDLHRIGGRHAAWIILCGLLFALDLYCWHASIQFVGPGLATILGNFQVFVLATFGVLLLREKVGLGFLLAIPIALFGLCLIVGVHWQSLSSDYRMGILLGLMTAVCYSGFLLILRKLQAEGEQFSFFFNLMLISGASALFLGFHLILTDASFAIPDRTSWLALLGLGLLSQTVGWTLIANALPRIRASMAGLVLLVQPSLSFVWDVLLFGRPTTLVNWLGVLITLTAIYLGIQSSRR